MKPLYPDVFYHDGRGPELTRVYWKGRGQVLQAIEYMPPDSSSAEDTFHMIFIKAQVVQIIPEEAITYGDLNDALIAHRPAALFDAGRTDWLKSFSQRHLSRCTHYKALFYDELFEVIAEGVEVFKGKHKNG
jgi:hypothetical protein